MDTSQFINKWRKSSLTERSAAQQHFLDLCELLGHPKPAESDPTGESFTFEKGAAIHGGGDGWADVWKRGFFAWEYKGKHYNLNAAYDQLLKYREALENPPLLVVCDMDRLLVHTNFTGTAKRVYDIPLSELGWPRNLEILRAVFFEPEKLRPGTVSATLTIDAARRIGEIARSMRERGLEPHDVAHFLDRIIFCLFAEDVGLLADHLFSRVLKSTRRSPPVRFTRITEELFAVMAQGGDFGLEEIRHFNGNLFNGGPILEMTRDEQTILREAAELDWTSVDASIFGTLFERGMDPAKRAQLGAHYTSREDIETLVEPVVMTPLRREWAEARQAVENLLATGHKQPTGTKKPLTAAEKKKTRLEADVILHDFAARLGRVTVLDPACGSGNFLYVTLQKLKDLEQEVIDFAMERDFSGFFPAVGPWQLFGLEVNEYAHDLAQMTVWIGYLQWTYTHGSGFTDSPLLRAMDNFQCRDAILDLSDPEQPRKPEWPAVDYIVGNPPFLGGNRIRQELGDNYVDQLFALYQGTVPAFSDLVCYWYECARKQIEEGKCKRAGLLATNSIRGGVNRRVLERIKETGDIFMAWSNRPWILEGAAVHVSMVGFDNGSEGQRFLDGKPIQVINSDLSTDSDISIANDLSENKNICMYGSQQKGSFDITPDYAISILHDPNPSGRPNSDVVKPAANGIQLLRRGDESWVIDFSVDLSAEKSALYEKPFEYVKQVVYPERINRNEIRQKQYWWLHARPSPRYRDVIKAQSRYLVTPAVSKHRIILWLDSCILADHACVIFAGESDLLFGVLQSRIHVLWSEKKGTSLEDRPRYTPSTSFETFPFPRPTEAQRAAIGVAAAELDRLRSAWLNPPEWVREEALTFPGSTDGPWARYLHDVDARGIGTVRYPRLVPKDVDSAARLKERTLTNLYNARPAWLADAHRALDEAVFDAYGWDAGCGDDALLGLLLALNLERAGEGG